MAGVRQIQLSGTVTTGTVEDGTVVLRGRLTETDYLQDGAIGFRSTEPFMIKAGGSMARGAFVLQWCALAPHQAEVTQGNLHVHLPAGSTATPAIFGLRSMRSCAR